MPPLVVTCSCTHIARILDDGALEPEADPEKGQIVLTSPSDGLKHPFHPSGSESAGDEQSVVLGQAVESLARGERFGKDPVDINHDVVRDPPMDQRFLNRLVRIDELGVLPHHRDFRLAGRRMLNSPHHV